MLAALLTALLDTPSSEGLGEGVGAGLGEGEGLAAGEGAVAAETVGLGAGLGAGAGEGVGAGSGEVAFTDSEATGLSAISANRQCWLLSSRAQPRVLAAVPHIPATLLLC